MGIKELCRGELGWVHEHETLGEASIKMRNLHAGALVVVAQSGARLIPIGLLSDRDIVVRGVARHPGTCASLPVREVMVRDIVVANEDDALDDVLTSMRGQGLRHMPVVDLSGSLVAVFHLDDLIEVMSKEMADLSKLLMRERRLERRALS
jgi:CBS domain-containing protein